MGDRVGRFVALRLEVVPVAGLLCIYFVVCFQCLVGLQFVFFVSFASNAHGLLQV